MPGYVTDPAIPSHAQAEAAGALVRELLDNVDHTVMAYVLARELTAFNYGDDALRSFVIVGNTASGRPLPDIAIFPEPAAQDPEVARLSGELAAALAAVPIV
jgi:hypothetical protein